MWITFVCVLLMGRGVEESKPSVHRATLKPHHEILICPTSLSSTIPEVCEVGFPNILRRVTRHALQITDLLLIFLQSHTPTHHSNSSNTTAILFCNIPITNSAVIFSYVFLSIHTNMIQNILCRVKSYYVYIYINNNNNNI